MGELIIPHHDVALSYVFEIWWNDGLLLIALLDISVVFLIDRWGCCVGVVVFWYSAVKW